jgi:hypothetical protein
MHELDRDALVTSVLDSRHWLPCICSTTFPSISHATARTVADCLSTVTLNRLPAQPSSGTGLAALAGAAGVPGSSTLKLRRRLIPGPPTSASTLSRGMREKHASP